jgi:hypothetical protein
MARSHKTMKKRGTRKNERVLTIPELRQSMDYITHYSHKLVRGGKKSDKDLAKAFSSEWKKTFGKSLSPKIAQSYIKHLKGKKGTRKHRGGAVLTGAPVDYMTGPNVSVPPQTYLSYVNKGFWNPEPAILQDCGKQTGVLPSSTVGSNLVGGGLLDVFKQSADALSFRPFVAQNPATGQWDNMMHHKGQPMTPGPESWQQTWTPKMTGQQLPPFVPTSVHERILANDVRTR